MTPKNGPIVIFLVPVDRTRSRADFAQQKKIRSWRRLASRERILNYFQNGGCSTGKTKGRRIMIFFFSHGIMLRTSQPKIQVPKSTCARARAHLKCHFWLFLCLHKKISDLGFLSQEAQIWHAYTRCNLEKNYGSRFLNF